MATRDPAFLWETEVLRSSDRPRRDHGQATAVVTFESPDWLTLREASEATGVPTGTIRKWAKNENIPSYMEKGPDGYLRKVSIDGIERWARQIGREIDTSPHRQRAAQAPAASPSAVDLSDGALSETELPGDAMLVPLDAWNRMLNQLGNLHEAGQQLAEARERAAKAETEATFLKERLAAVREELDQVKGAAKTAESADVGPPQAAGGNDSSATTSLLRRAYRSWRERGDKRG